MLSRNSIGIVARLMRIRFVILLCAVVACTAAPTVLCAQAGPFGGVGRST